MWSWPQIYEIKSSFISVYAYVFLLLYKEWYFDNNWIAEDDMMEILLCQHEKK